MSDGYIPDDTFKPRPKAEPEVFRNRRAVIIGGQVGPEPCLINRQNSDGTFDVRTNCCRRTVTRGQLIMDAETKAARVKT